jgi:DNA mismatch repair protein MutS2
VIYPQNFEEKTGFDKIRRLVAARCLSPLGEERVGEMSFSAHCPLVCTWLDQAGEFVRILRSDAGFPANYFIDMRSALRRIRPEGTFFDEKELFDLKRSLETIRDIVRFFTPEEGEHPAYPALSALAAGVRVFPQTIAGIDALLDRQGKIRDNASPALQQIRRDMASTADSISRSLQSILRAARAEGTVDKDATPAMRDGRLMIPVAPAFKRRIRGVVHDASASGKTLFIEPEAVVEANNRIRELEADERREIVRILTAFTGEVRPLAPDMLCAYAFLADMDFIRAKALFAEEINAIRPEIDDVPQIDFIRAVHPLLFLSHRKQGKDVVPLDIMLAGDARLLLVSGPNAGGKSVCLKTVGLLQYMLQCGMLIPVYERSRTGIFESIFIAIGDEQSIENDLSTYSSHLVNMKHFVKHCNERSLILIDEFGSGTEPRMGGAIAEALLDRFNRRGSFGVITTHYQNLKHFAQDTPGIVNGSMLYDRNLMQPLFRLSIGSPGSSFAIEIARKTGLPEDVIADASDKAGADYINLDKYLQDVVRDKRYWETKRRSIRLQEKKAEELAARYEQELEAINREKKAIIRQAREQAASLLAETNTRIEHTIREIRESQAGREQTRLVRRALDSFKASVLAAEASADNSRASGADGSAARPAGRKSPRPAPPPAPGKSAIMAGDAVRLKGQTAVGTAMEVHGKQATIAFGMIKSTVALDRLEKVDKRQIKQEMHPAAFIGARTADDMREKKLNFKQELDVRGMRGDEALQAVTYFIDDAILVGVSPVRILHGTGGGTLRRLIRDYLHTVEGVARYCDEHVQFGGAGITVVELE